MSSFADFKLLPSLLATLAEEGLVTPTEIQTRAVPALLQGKSVIASPRREAARRWRVALPMLHLLKTLENEGNRISERAARARW